MVSFGHHHFHHHFTYRVFGTRPSFTTTRSHHFSPSHSSAQTATNYLCHKFTVPGNPTRSQLSGVGLVTLLSWNNGMHSREGSSFHVGGGVMVTPGAAVI